MLRIIGAITVLMVLAIVAIADMPFMLNYQGRLTDSGGDPVADGLYLINFKLYGSETGDDSLWRTGFQEIQITDGLFNYQLGSVNPIPSDFFGPGSEPFLGIKVGTDPEIEPRTRLTSSAYAWYANRSDTAVLAQDISCYHCVSTDDIDDGCITSDKLVPGAVTSYNIQDNSIMDEDISGSAEIQVGKIHGTAANLSDDQMIGGKKTFIDLNISETTRRFSVPHTAFTPGNDNYSFNKNSGYLRNTSTSTQVYYAPVHLPEGATVTELKASFWDNEASNSGHIELHKFYRYTGSSMLMAQFTTSGVYPGIIHYSSTSITSETISNDGYGYYLMVSMGYSSSEYNMRFYGAEIVYTITRPLP